nr:hypothetical protein [Pedobacter sp. ASV2]
MKPSLPKLTAEVLAYKALNRDFKAVRDVPQASRINNKKGFLNP